MSNRVKRRRADAVDTRASAEGPDIGADVVDRLETPDRELFDRYRASAERLRERLEEYADADGLVTIDDVFAVLRLSENDR